MPRSMRQPGRRVQRSPPGGSRRGGGPRVRPGNARAPRRDAAEPSVHRRVACGGTEEPAPSYQPSGPPQPWQETLLQYLGPGSKEFPECGASQVLHAVHVDGLVHRSGRIAEMAIGAAVVRLLVTRMSPEPRRVAAGAAGAPSRPTPVRCSIARCSCPGGSCRGSKCWSRCRTWCRWSPCWSPRRTGGRASRPRPCPVSRATRTPGWHARRSCRRHSRVRGWWEPCGTRRARSGCCAGACLRHEPRVRRGRRPG